MKDGNVAVTDSVSDVESLQSVQYQSVRKRERERERERARARARERATGTKPSEPWTWMAVKPWLATTTDQ